MRWCSYNVDPFEVSVHLRIKVVIGKMECVKTEPLLNSRLPKFASLVQIDATLIFANVSCDRAWRNKNMSLSQPCDRTKFQTFSWRIWDMPSYMAPQLVTELIIQLFIWTEMMFIDCLSFSWFHVGIIWWHNKVFLNPSYLPNHPSECSGDKINWLVMAKTIKWTHGGNKMRQSIYTSSWSRWKAVLLIPWKVEVLYISCLNQARARAKPERAAGLMQPLSRFIKTDLPELLPGGWTNQTQTFRMSSVHMADRCPIYSFLKNPNIKYFV